MPITDANGFWQLVHEAAYIIEGENRAFEREYLHLLSKGLDGYLKEHPEIASVEGGETPLEHFAMLAVARLAGAFVFNDRNDSDNPAMGLLQARISRANKQENIND